MDEKHLKKCLISLNIRKMEIKTTMRFHLTPVRMAKIKISGERRCWRGYGERETLLWCYWGSKLVEPIWKSIWKFLRKLGIILPEDPTIPLRGIYPEDTPAFSKGTYSTMFIAALFIKARSWKEPKSPSTEEWIQKDLHFHNGVLYMYKMTEFIKFVGKWIVLSEGGMR